MALCLLSQNSIPFWNFEGSFPWALELSKFTRLVYILIKRNNLTQLHATFYYMINRFGLLKGKSITKSQFTTNFLFNLASKEDKRNSIWLVSRIWHNNTTCVDNKRNRHWCLMMISSAVQCKPAIHSGASFYNSTATFSRYCRFQ